MRGRTRGYLSAFPCEQGSSPTSNLNHQRDQIVAAAAIVPVDSNGEICVFNKQAGHVVVDVFGRFNADAELTSTGSTRLIDTRALSTGATHPAGTELRVDVGSPERTVALNVTVTQAAARGYLTVHECGTEAPETSNVNFVAQLPAPNLVVARGDATGHVCVTTTQNAHVIVDQLADFGASTTVEATAPVRLADTRGGAAPVAGEVVRIDVARDADADAPVSGIIGNLTITRPQGAGFATVFPCAGGPPETSNINYRVGQTIANAIIVEPDADGMVCVFTNTAAEVVFDLLGTTGAGFTGVAPNRPLDTRDG